MLYYALVGWATDGLGWKSDMDSIALWTGVFAVFGWLLTFVPIVLIVRGSSSLYSVAVFPWVGAFMGLLSFAILLSWWMPLWRHWFYALYPGIVGFSAALVFTWCQTKFGQDKKAS